MSKQCSKCKKIFDDSLTVCPDCGMGLISVQEVENSDAAEEAPVEQEAKQVSVFSLTNEDSANRIIDYMKEQGIEGNYQYSLREKIYKIYVSEKDRKVALRACTSFYAVEAQRLKAEEDKRRAEEEAKAKAEEEARLKAEEEARRKAEEEEEARRQAEEEAKRLQEEEIRKAEEEAIAKAEAAEKLKAELEAKVKAEEEAKVRAAQEAKIKAEEEAKAKALEVERLKAQAEEAKRKAEEAKVRIELEAKKRAEDDRLKAAEEARRRLKEEEEKKRLASEQRRSSFLNAIKESEEGKGTAFKPKTASTDFYSQFDIPHVTAETVQEEPSTTKVEEKTIFPENGPIFVETEPVDEYEIGDTIVVDAIDVESSDDDFYSSLSGSINDQVVEPVNETKSEFSDFISNVKKNKPTSFFGGLKNIEPDEEEEIFDNSYDSKEPVVEEMFTDNLFNKPEVVEEPKETNEKAGLFEEVINNELKKTSTNKFASIFEEKEEGNSTASTPTPTTSTGKKDFKSKFSELDNIDDIDNGTYRGFVPDYTQSTETDADKELADKYGFDAEAYKALKEQTAKRAQERKNNPIEKSPKANKDFKIVDDSELSDVKGFVPDYSSKEADKKMAFYGHTTIDYSKYRTKNTEELQSDALHQLNGTLRSSHTNELNKLFDFESLKNASKPKNYDDLKNTTYVLAITGTQLNTLFSAWLMTNCTKATTKIFFKPTVSKEENKKAAVDGIKAMLVAEFGKLDDAVLDVIVTRYYERFIEE